MVSKIAKTKISDLYFVGEVFRSSSKAKSLYFTIPKWLRERIGLEAHDIVKVTIEKIE